jgi:hypothetical protein
MNEGPNFARFAQVGPTRLFVRPIRLHAIRLASYVGDLGVWLARSYRWGEFDADHAVAPGVILRRLDNDTPVHLIPKGAMTRMFFVRSLKFTLRLS